MNWTFPPLKCGSIPQRSPDECDTRRIRRALIVENDRSSLKLLREMMALIGWESVAALNGRVAVEACVEERFDAIFMDLRMPVMDGFEATKLIRSQDGPNKNTPILAISIDWSNATVNSAFESGADTYIKKPVSLTDLAKAVEIATTRRHPEGPRIRYQEPNLMAENLEVCR